MARPDEPVPTADDPRRDGSLRAEASGSAQVFQSLGDQYIAGGNQHVHYYDHVRHVQRAGSAVGAGSCPYPGLTPFSREQACWFFGRDRLTADLVDRVAEVARRGGLLMVVGPSGAGKSSLLQAGLLPAVARGALPIAGSWRWPAVVFTPTAHPMHALARVISSLVPDHAGDDEDLAEVLLAEPHRAATMLGSATLDPATLDPAMPKSVPAVGGVEDAAARVILVVDQIEELFTLCTDEGERLAFIDSLACLGGLGSEDPPAASVVVGLRADFYGHCASYPTLRSALQDGQIVVGPLTEPQLREAIIFPAREESLDIEPGLVDLLLRDLGATAGSGDDDAPRRYEVGRLPFLAHALQATWQQRQGSTLTVAAYNTTGGIQHAVATTAERVFDRLHEFGRATAVRPPGAADDPERLVRTLLLRLIKIGDGTEDTRRRPHRTEVLNGLDHAMASRVVDEFTEARLLTQDRDTVMITHEALLRGWPRLRSWIDADRTDNPVRQELEEAAVAWQRGGCDASTLYRGSRLDNARTWSAKTTHALSPTAVGFLEASVAQERWGKRLRRASVAALVVLLVVATAGAVTARLQTLEARRQLELRLVAAANRAAIEADLLRSHDPALAMWLSLVAYRTAPSSPQVRSSLLSAAGSPHDTRMLHATAGQSNSVAYDGDGRVVSVLADGTLKLWDPAGGRSPLRASAAPPETGHTRAQLSASAKAHLAAVLTSPDSVALWDTRDPRQPLGTIELDDIRIFSLALNPTGQHLAVGTDGNGTRLFSLSDPQRPREVAAWVNSRTNPAIDEALRIGLDVDRVDAVAFSRDGETLAVSSSDATVNLYDVSDPRRPRPRKPLTEGDGGVGSLTFSGDGHTLAAARGTGVQLWDVNNPKRARATLSGHTADVNAVAASPHGQLAATASDDRTVRLWSTGTGRQLATLPHSSSVEAVGFSPDGATVVSATRDGTAHLWRLPPPGVPNGVAPNVIAFKPGSRVLAQGYADDTVDFVGLDAWRAWKPRETVQALPEAPGRDLAFSSDGRILATTTAEGRTYVWNLTDPRNPAKAIELIQGTGVSVAFAPLGPPRTMVTIEPAFVTGGGEIRLRLWGLDDLKHPDRMSDRTMQTDQSVFLPSLAISPDGRTIAIHTEVIGGGVTLWNVGDPRNPVPAGHIPGHEDRTVSSVAIGNHGRSAVVLAGDGPLEVWDISEPTVPKQVGVLAGPALADGSGAALAFTPAGTTVAAALSDHSIALWDVDNPKSPIALLAGHEGHISQLVLDPSSATLASLSDDGTVRVWTTDAGEAARAVCEVAGSPMTDSEWESYVPEIQKRDLCAGL